MVEDATSFTIEINPTVDSNGKPLTVSAAKKVLSQAESPAGSAYPLPSSLQKGSMPKPELINLLFNSGPADPFIFPANWFTSLSITNDFLKPSDNFSLEISGSENFELIQLIQQKIDNGAGVAFSKNGERKFVGYIDKIDVKYSSSGTKLTMSGNDLLGVVIDSCMTPDTKVDPKDTLETALLKAFAPFGWTKEDFIFKAGDEVLNKSQGSKIPPGAGVQYSGRRSFRDPTKQINRKQKAKKNEGCMQFAIRLAESAGLFINLSEDGKKILIHPPIYDRNPRTDFLIRHTINSNLFINNVLDGNLIFDWSEQVSMIIMEGKAGGGSFRKDTSKTIIINDLVAYDDKGVLLPDVQKIVDEFTQYKYTNLIPKNEKITTENIKKILKQNKSVVRPLYYYDQESSNKDELEFYARRKMGNIQSKAFKLKYKVQGHTNWLVEGDPVWSVNMMCKVVDDTLNINDYFWISKVTFNESVSNGKTTDIELQIPYIYDFDVITGGAGISGSKPWTPKSEPIKSVPVKALGKPA